MSLGRQVQSSQALHFVTSAGSKQTLLAINPPVMACASAGGRDNDRSPWIMMQVLHVGRHDLAQSQVCA